VSDVSESAAAGAQVGSGRRALQLLLCFSRIRHTLSSRELSEMTGIALPSIYRYVNMLRESGFLVGDDRGNYHLSVRLVGLGQAAEAAESIIGVADPVMRALADATGETVLLVKLIDRAAVCVHRIESSHELRTSFQPGQPLTLEHGASARILLSSMSTADQRATLDQVAAKSPAMAQRLDADIALARERGYATSREEIDRGIWAVSAPVRAIDGRTIAALSIPCPLVRAPVDRRDHLIDEVRGAAEKISALVQTSPH
jgi:DNA-binding IclR family transcriptional regulator